jgi:hypothetical protein
LWYGDGATAGGIEVGAGGWVDTATSDLDMAEYDIHNVVTLNVDHIGENTGAHTIVFDNDIDLSTMDIVTDTSTGTMIGTGASQKIGLWGATPVAQSTGWSVTNVASDKSFDASSFTVNELGNAFGTLITELLACGILGS